MIAAKSFFELSQLAEAGYASLDSLSLEAAVKNQDHNK